MDNLNCITKAYARVYKEELELEEERLPIKILLIERLTVKGYPRRLVLVGLMADWKSRRQKCCSIIKQNL